MLNRKVKAGYRRLQKIHYENSIVCNFLFYDPKLPELEANLKIIGDNFKEKYRCN